LEPAVALGEAHQDAAIVRVFRIARLAVVRADEDASAWR